jgi:hypothetical protein
MFHVFGTMVVAVSQAADENSNHGDEIGLNSTASVIDTADGVTRLAKIGTMVVAGSHADAANNNHGDEIGLHLATSVIDTAVGVALPVKISTMVVAKVKADHKNVSHGDIHGGLPLPACMVSPQGRSWHPRC